MKSEFLLDKSITFLNHGSFGSCPKPVFEEFQRFQLELETEPVDFIQKKLPVYLKEAKKPLAKFIGCNAEDFFFTPNPTFAINTLMRSLKLQPGDEILTTNHEYGAMDRTWNFYCKKSGAKYIRQEISLPIVSKEQIIEEFWKGYSKNTKVVFLNQMSSSTALIFPVKEICDKAQELGLITIIDGAHVPGHVDLNIQELNPDFYTGTLHKWMLAPKGSSFLYVKKEFQSEIDPLVVSWGYESVAPSDSQFLDYHEYQGTNDHSAFLCTPKVISFLEENNWKEKSKLCRQIVLENYQRFCDLVNTKPICPITEEFLGQMASIPVRTKNPVALKELLYTKYKIQIPVMPLNGEIYIRYSINVYNSVEDLDVLYQAITDIIKTTDLIEV
ncbi:aminotransferase class V-fold PLP-dependent enzyme [Flavobacterium aquatile]|uniref:Penicillin epimerase n=1 Tax=Flavobacterium aquatile LMG 4008 = ATCC 11947 TaxID=1453498 RepID=A0A095U036_9FLAO|nr:aminotransferase class V-fold PLP-dependent enzyme [Flavobacterium aquatile]KGD67983.1 penicillin epimerase [Flavobacterium aquatile LMG 4008 = ATCC 11947]OXA65340.1 penicillin epimerase [Flavobacterium aquatile] [Flavobacterium aquatile LMG 4008 = ATCC 11947]GEC78899.1 aminotransferase class V [Flavobacterium aquatile]